MAHRQTDEPGKYARKYSWRCIMLLKKIILSLVFVITLVGNLTKDIHGKKTILIYQVSLIFILSNWISNSYADTQLFYKLIKKIHSHAICGIEYNSNKSAAIINDDCSSAIYINFHTKQTFTIAKNKLPNHIFPTWISNTIATVESSCGTGCANVIIFVAPSIALACSDYQYRIESLDDHEPPDYYNNRPLLIDPKRKLYVCYDNEENIQIFPLPSKPTIHPPKGYFSEKAEIHDGKLFVIYKNRFGQTKSIQYGKL